ncbi:MAG: bifunctional 5,10-methylenetetrahydrofolate dehydrogenase/5,10-methenyltetrahydrofolate cyclohydrolase [Patescibacteria group bacterium]|nr:bifunctional 5,10-methylenetetrahydrofolate dehydrogenase/5,10-methenyltetrahydrofolate cyclohydrolase [Patescibacteria group bacterium]
MNIIFDGKSFAQDKEKVLGSRILQLRKILGRKPKLVAVGIGSEKDIKMYLRMKQKAAERLGVDLEKLVFDKNTKDSIILNAIAEKNSDVKADGILLELPLPKGFDDAKIMEMVSPLKDPDCMTYENLGRLLYGKPKILPATIRAIKDILLYYYSSSEARSLKDSSRPTASNNKFLSYKNAVVIGGGVELGKPLAMRLSDLGAAVSLCRSTTRDLSAFTKKADLIISAAGVPNLVKGNMVQEGVIVIDAGINLVNGKTAGDVEFESVSKKASFITPVPGGVGPVTIISLFENLVELIENYQ